jgi:hypothetical protein
MQAKKSLEAAIIVDVMQNPTVIAKMSEKKNYHTVEYHNSQSCQDHAQHCPKSNKYPGTMCMKGK